MRGQPLRKYLIFVAGIFAALFTLSAHAAIVVNPGTYEVIALVRKSVSGEPQAVFNWRTRSELKIALQGEKAMKLDTSKPAGLKIKIRVKKKMMSPEGEAELLDYSAPTPEEKIPLRVDNDFKPVKN